MIDMAEKLLTFAHVQRGDVMVAKDGSRWLVGRVERVDRLGSTRVRIWKADGPKTPLQSDVKDMERPSTSPVTIDRPEPDVTPDEFRRQLDEGQPATVSVSPVVEVVTDLSQAVANVKDGLGGQVVASVTDAQQASVDAAVESGEVLRMPPFSTYTMLQARTHLFLLHNVLATDELTLKELAAMHDEATARPVQGPPVAAHEHVEEVKP